MNGRRRSEINTLFTLASLLGAWGIWYIRPSWGWPVALPLLPILVSALTGALPAKPLRTDWPVLAFVGTAAVGVWAAYDQSGDLAVFPAPSGWQKLWGILIGALLFLVLSRISEGGQFALAFALLAGFGAAVAAWFLWTTDWAAFGEGVVISSFGAKLQGFLPGVTGHRINPNVAAGIIAPLLPLGIGLLQVPESATIPQGPLRALGIVLTLTMAMGLLFTASLGGWLAGASALALWALLSKASDSRRPAGMLLAVIGIVAVAAIVLFFSLPALRTGLLDRAGSSNRFAIYSQALLLMRDFAFTGAGLGNFALVHSTYALMIHVPILPHAHSLLLDVAIEQGILGSILALTLLTSALVRGLGSLRVEEGRRKILLPALASLAVVVIHSVVDDPLYSSRGIVLLWVPAALVFGASPSSISTRPRGKVLSALALLLVALGLLTGRQLLGAWWANLGAIAQAKEELPRYDYVQFDDPTLDELRQQIDTTRAEDLYYRALRQNPGQVTALTRLSGLAFSRKAYDAALNYAERVPSQDRVSRLVLGDALVAQMRPADAAGVVQGLAWAADRLRGEAWYKYWRFGDYQRAASAWEAAVLLDPTDKESARSLAEARQRLAPN